MKNRKSLRERLADWREGHPAPEGMRYAASAAVHTSWLDDDVALEMYREGIRWAVCVVRFPADGEAPSERWLDETFGSQGEAYTAGVAAAYGLDRKAVDELLQGLMRIGMKWRFGSQVLSYTEAWKILLALEPAWDRYLPSPTQILERVREADEDLYRMALTRIVEPRRQAKFDAVVKAAKKRAGR